MTVLAGLRVVEISGNGAAAVAGKHFADWGASVTLLEPIDGTPLRNAPPYYEKDGRRRSATWEWLSRGKVAVRVGEGAKVSAADARRFCENADVVLVESEMAPAVLGLGPAEVRPYFEGKTNCVLISPFASDGPYAHYAASDLGISALGGWMGMLGEPSREPLRPGGEMMPRVGGLFALVAALAALRHVRQGGAPQFVDLSLQAVAASVIVAPWLSKSMYGLEMGRRGSHWPRGVMECVDGFVGCQPLTATHWEMLCRMMGVEDALEEIQGQGFNIGPELGEELYRRVRPWLMEHSRAEIFAQAQTWRLPAAPVETLAERLNCPQLAARGFFATMGIDGKAVQVPRVPYLIQGLQPVARRPLQEVETVDLAAPSRGTGPGGVAPALPFAGIRVLDLTWFWSGPYAMMLLGALGADVIKVESIQRPDSYRYTQAPAGTERWYERGALWNDTNCNKRGITLDLTAKAGRELFERLVAQADVVISNFSNRVMPNLGLTNRRLLAINPRLIAVTMPGYGTGGPWEGYVGYGVSFEQLVCAWMTGYADGLPMIMGGFCDPTVGLHTVVAVEMALRQRELTGRGTEVEIPQCEVLDSLFAPEHIAIQHGAPVPTRRGNRHEWMAPHNAYRVAGADQWITIAVASDGEFAALAGVLGLPALVQDSRFATAAARKANEEALDAVIAAAVRDRNVVALERDLQAAGVKACRVSKPFDLPEDEGLQHIGFFQRLTRPVTGTHPYKTWPFRFSSIDASHKRPAPLLGEHNREVLTGLLGLSAEELAHLEEEQVIGDTPIGFAG